MNADGVDTLLAVYVGAELCRCGRSGAVVRNPANRSERVCWYCWRAEMQTGRHTVARPAETENTSTHKEHNR